MENSVVLLWMLLACRGHLDDLGQELVQDGHAPQLVFALAIVEQGPDAVRVALSAEYHPVVLELVVLVGQVLDDQQVAENLGLLPECESPDPVLALGLLFERVE